MQQRFNHSSSARLLAIVRRGYNNHNASRNHDYYRCANDHIYCCANDNNDDHQHGCPAPRAHVGCYRERPCRMVAATR